MKRGGKVRSNFIVISGKWEKKKKSEGMKIYLSREKYIYIYSKEDKERQREYETSKVSKSDVE